MVVLFSKRPQIGVSTCCRPPRPPGHEKKRKRDHEGSQSRDDQQERESAHCNGQNSPCEHVQEVFESDAKHDSPKDGPRRSSRDVEIREDVLKSASGVDNRRRSSAPLDDRGHRTRHDAQRLNSTRPREDSRRFNESRRYRIEHEPHRRRDRHAGDSPARRPRSQDRRSDVRRGDPYVRDHWRDDERYNGSERRSREQYRRSYHVASSPRRRDRDQVTSDRRRSRSRDRLPSTREKEVSRVLSCSTKFARFLLRRVCKFLLNDFSYHY